MLGNINVSLDSSMTVEQYLPKFSPINPNKKYKIVNIFLYF